MNKKAVIFDLDDTLYGNFDALNQQAFESVGTYAEQNFGIPATQFANDLWEAKRYLYKTLPDQTGCHDRVLYMQLALEKHGVNPIAHADKMHHIYWNAIIDHIVPRSGVPELLDELRAAGYTIAVCTNMLPDMQMKKICKLGIHEKIDFLVTSEEAGLDKPERPIFDLVLRKCACSAENALFVGDSFHHDIEGALAADIPAAWLNWKNQEKPFHKKEYYEIHALQEIKEILSIM